MVLTLKIGESFIWNNYSNHFQTRGNIF
jgi:hypothetical protein